MTCLLPPEAAKVLKGHPSDSTPSDISPDALLDDFTAGEPVSEPLLDQLYESVVYRARSDEQIEKLITECDSLADVRSTLKKAMHEVGLGLRHVRLVVPYLNPTTRKRVVEALCFGGGSRVAKFTK